MRKTVVISSFIGCGVIALVYLSSGIGRNKASDDRPSPLVVNDSAITHTVASDEAFKPARNVDKIQQIFLGAGDIREHLNSLHGFTDTEVIAMWEHLLAEKDIVTTGLIHDLPENVSIDIFNKLLNRLSETNMKSNSDDELERVKRVFQSLVAEENVEEVLRDYAIQSAIIWITDSGVTLHREAILDSVLKVVTDDFKTHTYTGTAINMLTVSDEYWTPQEEGKIVACIEQLIATNPDISTLIDEVAIPIAHAADFWKIQGREKLYDSSKEGSEYLKFIITNLQK